MQSAICNMRNVKCNVQTRVLAVQGLSASVAGLGDVDETLDFARRGQSRNEARK